MIDIDWSDQTEGENGFIEEDLVLNPKYDKSEIYSFVINTLYSPHEEKYYIERVTSLYNKYIRFPVDTQKLAIEKILSGEKCIVLTSGDRQFEFHPFDILYIQFTRVISNFINRSNLKFQEFQDYDLVISEIWTNIIENLNKYNPNKSKPITFIVTIALNKITDLCRKSESRGKYNTELSPTKWLNLYEPDFVPELIHDIDLYNLIDEEISDPVERKVFIYRYIYNMTLQET
ncbi:MAG: sigma-70 family RNA polymerase sigma factor, partial [Romboutsia sp.]|nr:sigma-70 family RNA polymerase sigma factor [Romboutsia sp.]